MDANTIKTGNINSIAITTIHNIKINSTIISKQKKNKQHIHKNKTINKKTLGQH